MVRYFRKLSPETRVVISQGLPIQFKTLDGLQGFFATDSDFVVSEFERAMREGRYGISEVSWSEYESSYLSKKNSGATSKAPWREELVKGQMMPSTSQLSQRLREAQAVVGVVSEPPKSYPAPSPSALSHATQPAMNAEIAKALPTVEDYKPEVGKRKRAKT